MPKTLHAKTAAALIPVRYPAFDLPEVTKAVRWHTTGHAGMTITERILYFADYIDDTRTFPDCVELRHMFWDPHPESMTPDERFAHLRKTMIRSFDMTIHALLEEGIPISQDTISARNALLFEAAASK